MDEQRAPILYRVAEWPTGLVNPRDVLGQDSLDAGARAKLAASEVPFVITSAERFFWPDGKEAVSFGIIVAPDDDHDTAWYATLNLGLPTPDPTGEKLSDRERILAYFENYDEAVYQRPQRPCGPFVAVMVPTSFPQPYFAMRAATEKQLAAHSMNISALRADRAANVHKTDGKGNKVS